MLSRVQQILLKRAQREADVSDDEYRDTLEMVAGCRSSTSPALTDRHLDKILAYFETIFWRGVDAGELQASCSPTAVFRQRGYWSGKNTNAETSRDRFNGRNQGGEISTLEAQLAALGFGTEYVSAIRANVCKGRTDGHALHLYQAALARTLAAKVAKKTGLNFPPSGLLELTPGQLGKLVKSTSRSKETDPDDPF